MDGPIGDAASVRARIDAQVDEIEKSLASSRMQIEEHNARIRAEVPGMVSRRRAQLLAARNLQANIGFPVRRRPDADTYTVPIKRRNLRLVRPAGTPAAAPFKPEPTMADGDYQAAPAVLRTSRNALERTLSLPAKLNEEQVRDLLLVNLNAHFEGDAAGEVFNGEGKTDILIRVEDRNIFIGECKIWGGPSTMDEALGQIFKYLVWRDTKAAILLFIRNKDVTAVIKKAVAKIEAHPNYKRRGPSHRRPARFRHACPRRRRAGDPPGIAALRVADHYERSDSLGPPRRFHADYTTSARSAALIMFFAFGTLSTGPETDLKVAATAFGAGILLDATVVPGLLVPALVAVFGNWNWWLPAWARRLLRLLALPPTGPAMTRRATAGTGHGR